MCVTKGPVASTVLEDFYVKFHGILWLIQAQSCNQNLSNFTDIINHGLDTLAPLKAVKVHHND